MAQAPTVTKNVAKLWFFLEYQAGLNVNMEKRKLSMDEKIVD